MDGEKLEKVDEYKYLDTLLTPRNEISVEINQGVNEGRERFGQYSHFLKGRNIPNSVKRRIKDTVILPSLIHGSETWALIKHQLRKLAARSKGRGSLLSRYKIRPVTKDSG